MTGEPAPRPPHDGAVVLSAVGKSFGSRKVLRDVSLRLHPGEVTAILGPNGAGKSTLLAILSTMSKATTGHVTRLDRGDIGWVGHEPGLYGDLPARDNLMVFARLYGLRDAAERVGAMLDRVGLTDVAPAEAPVRTFSRGMTQRLALARALLHQPRVLLFDEPSSALDPAGAEWLIGVLRAERDAGRVVVLVTHDLDTVGAAADHVVILRRGRVLLDETFPRGLTGPAIRRLYEERVLGRR